MILLSAQSLCGWKQYAKSKTSLDGMMSALSTLQPFATNPSRLPWQIPTLTSALQYPGDGLKPTWLYI
eukprot:964966-Ditylum_brightwellii.AAC.1